MIPQHRSSIIPFENGQLSKFIFEEIREEYLQRFGYTIIYSDTDGNLIYGIPNCVEFPCLESCRLARQHSIEMAISYGAPLPTRCPSTYLFLAIPISINNQVIGALITVCDKFEMTQKELESEDHRIKDAQDGLLRIAERYNIVNQAFLQQRQKLLEPSSDRFPKSITTPKTPILEELWMKEGMALLQAVSNGNHPESKKIITKMIDALQSAEKNSLPEAKGFTLELFAAVVEHSCIENGNRKNHFYFHYQSAEKIVGCKTIQELCDCIREQIQTFIEATQRYKTKEKNAVISRMYSYIEHNLEQPLSRKDVASVIGISPSRLSHVLQEEAEESFSEIVSRFRMEQARRLLISRSDSISAIAAECGYCDQSHFSKVFHKTFGRSPREYRVRHKG